jgi:hypothetical protein
VINEFGQDSLKVLGVDDQNLVQAFPPCGPHPPFRVCVRPRRPDRCLEHLDGVGGEDGVERGGELGVTVADKELERVDPVAQAHHEIAGLLGNPLPGRMGGDAQNVHPPGGELDHEEHV